MRKSFNILCQTAALIDIFFKQEPTKLSSCQNSVAKVTGYVALRNKGCFAQDCLIGQRMTLGILKGKMEEIQVSRFSKAISIYVLLEEPRVLLIYVKTQSQTRRDSKENTTIRSIFPEIQLHQAGAI